MSGSMAPYMEHKDRKRIEREREDNRRKSHESRKRARLESLKKIESERYKDIVKRAEADEDAIEFGRQIAENDVVIMRHTTANELLTTARDTYIQSLIEKMDTETPFEHAKEIDVLDKELNPPYSGFVTSTFGTTTTNPGLGQLFQQPTIYTGYNNGYVSDTASSQSGL